MLKKQELIRVKPTGMEITNEGTEVLAQLGEYFNVYSDDHKLASAIKDKFHIKDVHVIPGDSDSNRTVKREMGQQAGQLLEGILYEDAIVSVTGGSTMACVSESIHLLPFNVFFVPARGGLEKMLFIKRIQSLRVWPNKLVAIIQHSMFQTT